MPGRCSLKAVAGLVVALAIAGHPALATGTASAALGRHCVMELHETGRAAPPAAAPVCFGSFADAVFYGTSGRVTVDTSLDTAAQMAAADAALIDPVIDVVAGSKTVLGVDYIDSYYRGASLLWTTTNSNGCAYGSSFDGDTMPAGFNNAVSSAKSYQSCSFFGHYEYTYQVDPVKDCGYSCSYIGDTMNDKTSSVRFRRS